MEMHSLTRYLLRTRPTPLHIQSITNGPKCLRYASSAQPKPPSNQPAKPKEQQQPPSKPTQTSPATAGIDQILNELNLTNRTTASSNTPSDAPRHRGSAGRPRSFMDALSISRAAGHSAETENLRPAVYARRIELKLGPTLGRQVHVEPERGQDLAAALRSLQVACNTNRVRQQSNQQKFHVRRGQMKKNLRMERWRKLFKFSFTHTVSKIQRMRAQGW